MKDGVIERFGTVGIQEDIEQKMQQTVRSLALSDPNVSVQVLPLDYPLLLSYLLWGRGRTRYLRRNRRSNLTVSPER